MIGYLNGLVVASVDSVYTVLCSGVGYEVHVAEPKDGTGLLTALWIHEHAPQDAPHELYGFREREQRDLFRRLLDIKGVGPKVAMRVVSAGIFPALFSGIEMERAAACQRLNSIRGVGVALAQRICEAMT